ncbi:MAG: endonuclease NucS domain-containing protein [Candidatus Hodarchaeales archaeon]|jgi:RecB family endonuclease NucS
MENKIKILSTDPDQLINSLQQIIGIKSVIICGNCSAVFEGRINSTLDRGERFLLIKSDTSVLLHSPTGVKPVNWQIGGAGKLEFFVKEQDQFEIYSFRKKSKETFSIVFDRIDFALEYNALDTATLLIEGDETDLVNYLVQHSSELIEEGLTITGREIETSVGFIDLLGRDTNGIDCIIEVKKQSATPADSFQLLRYVEAMKKAHAKNYRGIIISAKTPPKVARFLTKNGLEHREILWQEIFPSLNRKKIKSLTEFF